MHALLFSIKTVQMEKRIDTEAALISIHNRTRSIHQQSIFMWIQRIAAVLFIPLLITFLAQNMKKEFLDEQLIEIKTNPGMITNLTLPDGSKIILNSNTYFAYPATFSKDSRSVILDGEAWFSITRDPDTKFIVKTPLDARSQELLVGKVW